jgi:predicted mannosyl-3-phosphoglycerate phosphatase (HAD superfamily)
MEEIPNTVNNEECVELKNIKYKTMLLSGVPIQETKSANDLSNLEKFLENEQNNNKNEPWCKLDKTIKTNKLLEYVNLYKVENKLDDEESELLVTFFKDCLDRKRFQRVKDVVYDKTTGLIKEIPALSYTKATKHFTLKNIDKRVSTQKSLPAKKLQSTIKNKPIIPNKIGKDSELQESK